MALLDRFFKRKPQAVATSATPVELLSGNAAFTQWGGNAYENDIYRAAVDAIARNAAKLKGCHIIQTGEVKKPATDKVNRLLQVQPNRYPGLLPFEPYPGGLFNGCCRQPLCPVPVSERQPVYS